MLPCRIWMMVVATHPSHARSTSRRSSNQPWEETATFDRFGTRKGLLQTGGLLGSCRGTAQLLPCEKTTKRRPPLKRVSFFCDSLPSNSSPAQHERRVSRRKKWIRVVVHRMAASLSVGICQCFQSKVGHSGLEFANKVPRHHGFAGRHLTEHAQ